MALGKYTRVDNRRSSSSYCSTVTIVVFVALCLVGVWMMTSSSVVPVQNVDVSPENKSEVKAQESKTEVSEQVSENNENNVNNESNAGNESNEGNTRQFEDNPGDLPEDATKEGDSNVNVNNQEEEKQEEKSEENAEEKPQENQEEKPEEKREEKADDGSKSETENGETSTEGGDNNENKSDSDESQTKSDTDDNEQKSEKTEETQDTEKIEEKVEQNDKESDDGSGEKKENDQAKSEVYPSGAQSELLNETATQNNAWKTQAAESKNEKEAQRSSNQQTTYSWKLCNSTAGPDFIPCLDNWQAIRSLHSTKHYEHRERHCPEEAPTCLVPLPEGYKRSIQWPKSREKVFRIVLLACFYIFSFQDFIEESF